MFDATHDVRAGLAAAAERMALAVLDGSCHTPIGAHAILDEDVISLKVLVASGDGIQIFRDEQAGPVQNDAQN